MEFLMYLNGKQSLNWEDAIIYYIYYIVAAYLLGGERTTSPDIFLNIMVINKYWTAFGGLFMKK